ncbi:hypothetical protein C5167_015358 [Papaver somniferum]|uniref:Uncharacterized protein n=1 Tax=Papaver somniferum TaxID=3469 RepID=A0A4Y7J7Q7_PAPSO|nr:hypothetical protein C5167_015358 [Papaver somniferum]
MVQVIQGTKGEFIRTCAKVCVTAKDRGYDFESSKYGGGVDCLRQNSVIQSQGFDLSITWNTSRIRLIYRSSFKLESRNGFEVSSGRQPE